MRSRAEAPYTTFRDTTHAKDPLDFTSGNFSIEHIMPQNALASAEWREMLGDDCERVYEELINTLGNLTLTAYNPELSDAPFAEKKAGWCALQVERTLNA